MLTSELAQVSADVVDNLQGRPVCRVDVIICAVIKFLAFGKQFFNRIKSFIAAAVKHRTFAAPRSASENFFWFSCQANQQARTFQQAEIFFILDGAAARCNDKPATFAQLLDCRTFQSAEMIFAESLKNLRD